MKINEVVMRILITGGTGLLGKSLVSRLFQEGHELTILTRSVKRAEIELPYPLNFVEWDYADPSKNSITCSLENVDGIIHLMGENLAAKRWSDKQKKLIEESRVKSTKILVDAINAETNSKIKFFITANAIGYYPLMHEN